MKILSFLLFFAISFLLIGVSYWLLAKLFIWFIPLTGFWFYLLLIWFAFLSYRFSLTNIKLFRLRKIALKIDNSILKWIRTIPLVILSICGMIYIFKMGILPSDYSITMLIGYFCFIYLMIQLTINLIFTLLSGSDS